MKLFLFHLVGFAALTLAAWSYRLILLMINQDAFSVLTLGQQVYAMIWGLRFDAAITAPLSFVSFLLGYFAFLATSKWKTAMFLFWAGLAVISVFQLSDMIYFQESGRHVSYEVRDVDSGVFSLAAQGINSNGKLVAGGLLLMAAVGAGLVFSFKKLSKNAGSLRFRRRQISGWILLMLFTVIAARGGIRGVPQNPLHVHAIGDARQALIASNGAYNIAHALLGSRKGIEKRKLPKLLEPVEKTMRRLYPVKKQVSQNTPSTMSINEPSNNNIVLIFLEGWPASRMKSYGFDKNTTPVFDELRETGLTATLMLAGGHRTTEGLFATLCSYQNPLGKTVARSQLETYNYYCLPEILREKGYFAKFIQGSHKDTSGTGVVAQSLGFQESIGKEELPKGKHPHNAWGAQDSDIYDYVLDIAPGLPRPFLIGINTNSTHDEVLPEGVEERFSQDVEDYKKLNVLSYADWALGDFLEKYSKLKDLAEDTIFVLLADHTSGVGGGNLSQYAIPFVMFGPGTPRRKVARAASQRDAAPTILDALGLDIPKFFSGKSLLQDDEAPYFADYYHEGVLGWIQDDELLEVNIFSGEIQCFDWRTDPDQKSPRECSATESEMKRNALGFTEHSQSLLFDDKVKMFADF